VSTFAHAERRAGLGRLSRGNRATAHPGGGSTRWGLAILIVLVSVYVQTQESNFLTEANLQTIILNVSSLLIAAAAMMRLVVAGNVDLSIGGQLSLLSVLGALVARDTGSAVLAVAVALGVGAVVGLVNGVAVRLLSISPLIVTLGLSFVYFGLAYAFSDSLAVFGLPTAFLELGLSRFAGIPTPVVIALIYFAVCAFLLTRTTGGVRRFAIGGNAAAARSEGINVDRAMLADFVFMGFTMGIVAVLTTARIQSGSADIGVNFELETLTAVIVGGVAFNGGAGRPLGVFLGVLLLGTIDAAMVFLGFADYYQQIAKGGILLLALAADQYARYRARMRTTAATADQGGKARTPGARLGDMQLKTPSRGTIAARVKGISKNYGAVQALDDISFDVRYGEVTCLLGDNGAGKSTLIKILAGTQQPSSGDILINESEEVDLRKTDNSREAGVETVWQDLAVCQNLGAAYNLALGNEPSRMGVGPFRIFDRKAAEEAALKRLASIGVNLSDMFRPLSDLSGGQRQSVSISRVVSEDVKIVILDEPTAALGVHQTRNVVALIKELAESGAAVILVSHDIEIVQELADHYVILNRGALVADARAKDMTPQKLVHLMAGLVDTEQPEKPAQLATS
jgi:ribose/xylose/arabinose/galactoside ABC-type transport system permease subunit/ABC-type multidrug transport system ATPase subunit